MSGEKFRTGSYALKNVAGYDLKFLIVGSEGTLVIITKIALRLLPLPAQRILFRIDFKSLKAGASFIQKIILSGLSPSVLEFMDVTSINAVYNYLNLKKEEDHNASVLMEIDGTEIEIQQKKMGFEKILGEFDIVHHQAAQSLEDQELLWNIRRNISPAISHLRPKKINEDIAVPIKHIPQTVDFINSLAKELDLLIIMFGHFGDGNIHTNIMIDPELPKDQANASKALDLIFKFVIEKKGTISGEHGIGLSKKEFMHYQFKPHELELDKEQSLICIGTVSSEIKNLNDCPKQGTEGAPQAKISIKKEYVTALKGVAVGSRLVLLTWLHLADRSVLQIHPRGDKEKPLTGVFSTRSPARPNPIGLHEVEVVGIDDECTITVHPFEVLDSTPVIDINW